MTDQTILFTLLFFVFVFLIWGRWRYDLVAFSALLIAAGAGVIPAHDVFSGFGHPAVVVIALVLIVSRSLSNSGAIELLSRYLISGSRKLSAHISIMAGFAAVLSAVMNNVAALALLMPLDIQAAAKAKRSPALSLMPLSFASILGGMITLIGTPPNIVIAEYRNSILGEPYHMFDFAPVGLAVAIFGVAYVALIGWRLIPVARGQHDTPNELSQLGDYLAEVKVPAKSPVIGQKVRDLDEKAAEHDVEVVGLIRRGERQPGMARRVEIRKNDILVLKASPEGIEAVVGALKLTYSRKSSTAGGLFNPGEDSLLEVVVPQGARIEGRSAHSLRLMYRHGVTLLGVSRQGKRFSKRVQDLEIQAGDILLLLGNSEKLDDIVGWLGCLPLAERGLQVTQRKKAGLAVLIFAAAVLLASFGVLYLPVALGFAVILMVLTGIMPLRQIFQSIEWPVIRAAWVDDPHRGRARDQRWHRHDRSTDRQRSCQCFTRDGAGHPDGRDDDAVGRDEQRRHRRDRRAHCSQCRQFAGCQSGPIPDVRRSGFELRIPDPYRPQEQYPHTGSRRLSLWRLLAHGTAA